MAQRSGALGEGPTSVPRTHTGQCIATCKLNVRNSDSLSGLADIAHESLTYIHRAKNKM